MRLLHLPLAVLSTECLHLLTHAYVTLKVTAEEIAFEIYFWNQGFIWENADRKIATINKEGLASWRTVAKNTVSHPSPILQSVYMLDGC